MLRQIKGESIGHEGGHHKGQGLLLPRGEEMQSHRPQGLVYHLHQAGQYLLQGQQESNGQCVDQLLCVAMPSIAGIAGMLKLQEVVGKDRHNP